MPFVSYGPHVYGWLRFQLFFNVAAPQTDFNVAAPQTDAHLITVRHGTLSFLASPPHCEGLMPVCLGLV
jgi:hypothetical protein